MLAHLLVGNHICRFALLSYASCFFSCPCLAFLLHCLLSGCYGLTCRDIATRVALSFSYWVIIATLLCVFSVLSLCLCVTLWGAGGSSVILFSPAPLCLYPRYISMIKKNLALVQTSFWAYHYASSGERRLPQLFLHVRNAI